jgi:succinate dehydrogenase/fumarate reductase cytochrome b subunit
MKKLDETMAHLCFIKSNADKCLYILHKNGQVILLVLVYVNDAVVTSKQPKHIEEFKQQLQEFFISMILVSFVISLVSRSLATKELLPSC